MKVTATHFKKALRMKEKLHAILDRFEKELSKMPQKGNSSENCQRVCISVNLLDVRHSVTGIEPEDFIPNSDF